MFVIIYQPSDQPITLVKTPEYMSVVGTWKVDTEKEGQLSMYEDLEEALDRVKTIRQKGGEACLAVVIE